MLQLVSYAALVYTHVHFASIVLHICIYVSFKQPLSLHAPADWLRETSFVEEPSSELTVREGDTLQVPCVINTAVDTNLSQVYWSAYSNVRGSIREVLQHSEHAAALTYSTKQACTKYLLEYGRIFYTTHHRRVHDENSTELLEVSVILHLCNVEVEDSGVFQCWHPDVFRRTTLQVKEG